MDKDRPISLRYVRGGAVDGSFIYDIAQLGPEHDYETLLTRYPPFDSGPRPGSTAWLLEFYDLTVGVDPVAQREVPEADMRALFGARVDSIVRTGRARTAVFRALLNGHTYSIRPEATDSVDDPH